MVTTSNAVTLEENIPLEIALQSTDPKIIWDGSRPVQTHYQLVDGRSLFLPFETSSSITLLELADKEPFFICRYSSKDRRVKDRINVWLSPAGEKERARQERERAEVERDTLLERQLEGSIHLAKESKHEAPPAPTAPVPAKVPAPAPTPIQTPAALSPLCTRLLVDTKNLLTVYSEAVRHAEDLGVPSGIVRSIMLSAYIGLSQRGGGRAA